ncbi:MAG: hypothetical protein U1F76_22915 [Candidatus Competibacteraceae bacterium]
MTRLLGLGLETLNRFLASAALALTLEHVPLHGREAGETLVALARRLWSLMGDPDSPVGMVHDGYLKLFQLSQPERSGFDRILSDEAQDANPATLDIVRRQALPQALCGGDPGRRGAGDQYGLTGPAGADEGP